MEKEIKEILNDKFIEKYFDKNFTRKYDKKRYKNKKQQLEKILMEAKIFEIENKEIKKDAIS